MTGSRLGAVAAPAVVLMCAYVAAAVWALNTLSYDLSGPFLIGPVLIALSLPLLRRVAAGAPELTLQLLVLALLAKLASSFVRYSQLYVFYEGGADSETYHDAGTKISAALRGGLPWEVGGQFPGTGFVEGVTGYLYLLTGPSRIGGFLIFSWFGFWGLLLFQRAFATALPHANARLYALLVLFLPSLLFWPSSIGKEALVTLGLGLGAYGAARIFARRPAGFLCLALGLSLVGLVRPHMAALLFGGLFVGYLARPSSPDSALGPLIKTGGTVVLAIVGVLLVVQAERFFGVEDVQGNSLTAVLDRTQGQTSQGGSSFEATPVSGPADMPMAIVTVLLRPFPWEANTLQALMASAESCALVLLAWRRRASLKGLPHALRNEPYVALVTSYTLAFVIAFSSFANFGILTRQRVQVFPFVLVLLALPIVAERVSPTRPGAGPVADPVPARRRVGGAEPRAAALSWRRSRSRVASSPRPRPIERVTR